MNNRLYVDVHVIQTMPPSCVNRDDTGSPKTAFYGGVTRARVSSQAWKRAMRNDFEQMFKKENAGYRTKYLLKLVSDEIKLQNPNFNNPDAAAKKVIEAAGITFDSKKSQEIKVLFFISQSQVNALADLALMSEFDPTQCKKALKENPSFDIALFGRMAAEDPSLNYGAASQVAHAISTHEVHNEFDYFTAVDDIKDKEETSGAGHLGTIEYNSSTLYRYAVVNAIELQKNLKDKTAHVIKCFVEAFIKSMPTGKQNSFANGVRPDAIYVTIRKDTPINMAGAFEKPIQPGKDGKEGYVEGSIKKLMEYALETYKNFYQKPEAEFYVGKTDGEHFKDGINSTSNDNGGNNGGNNSALNLTDMLNRLEEKVNKCLSEAQNQ